MTTEETQKLGEEIQQALGNLNKLLNKATQNEVNVALQFDRKSSTTTDVISRIQLVEMNQSSNITFDTETEKGKW